ncbi:MAG TPA: hypothetical protein VJW23_12460 [Propionibacteriaceae bacterium]|nr:hypothetical protein [Propionibacteriaceae bacterium]
MAFLIPTSTTEGHCAERLARHAASAQESPINPLDVRYNLLDLILNWVVPIAILVFMLRFTAIYPDRARKAAGLAEEPQLQPHGRAEAALHKRLSAKRCS